MQECLHYSIRERIVMRQTSISHTRNIISHSVSFSSFNIPLAETQKREGKGDEGVCIWNEILETFHYGKKFFRLKFSILKAYFLENLGSKFVLLAILYRETNQRPLRHIMYYFWSNMCFRCVSSSNMLSDIFDNMMIRGDNDTNSQRQKYQKYFYY